MPARRALPRKKSCGHWRTLRLLPVLVAMVCSCTTGMAGSRGSVLLVGGGSENYNDWSDKPYRWLVEHAPNRRIAILHYSTTSSWLVSYFRWLGASSDTTFAISSTASANDSACYRAILACDGIFLRGGDQWQYINRWKGTLTEQAIREVYQRGGTVGGTSAGLAVLTEVIVDARVTSVDPRTALRNPLEAGITFTEGFLGFVPGIIGDTHFFERGRLGRLLAMLAVYRSQTGRMITGVGVDYNTALAVDSSGTGEVMGAGTVTVLRWRPETRYALEASKPLSITGMGFDQLTEGFRVSLPSGTVTPGSEAAEFSPKKFTGPTGSLILDGSSSQTDWTTPAGGVSRILQGLSQGDTLGIITSPIWGMAAQYVSSFLAQRNIAVRELWVDGSRKDDVSLAMSFSGCKGFVFLSNSADSVASYLDPSSAAGGALRTALHAGTPASFLGNDSKIVPDTLVGRTESSAYAAYYGELTLSPGIRLVPSLTVMPRLYENADSIDNRASGLFWGLAKSRSSFGVLLDVGSSLTLAGKQASVAGSTPAMIIDARNVTCIAFPTWRDPGKANPRQNAGLVDGAIHVVRDGESLVLGDGGTSGIMPRKEDLPSGFVLEQNFPNPFNPSTTIRYTVPVESFVQLTISDILGHEIAVPVRGQHSPGTFTFRLDGSNLASGAYFYTMRAGGSVNTKSFILIK
jgi:cyanophycinase